MVQMFQSLERTLGADQTLKMSCGRCGHGAEWTRLDAISRLGPTAAPAECRRRLMCGACGERKDVNVWI